jgi:hypothetical protein
LNKDWIAPDINKDYEAWAEHNHTAIMPARIRRPKDKSSVECSVGIMEKGFFHDLAERKYFGLDQFNEDLWEKLDQLNRAPFKKKEHCRAYYWEEEQKVLMQLPSTHYQYMERRIAKVSSDYHVRFDSAYYSVCREYLHRQVQLLVTDDTVTICSLEGELLKEWPRATHRGQWSTDPAHLPRNYRMMSNWNAGHFINWAMTIGPNTVKVIQYVLKSREVEVQAYRSCQGILGYANKYGREILEECCTEALKRSRISYSTIKNSIGSFSDDPSSGKHSPHRESADDMEARNKGSYRADPELFDVDCMLERSKAMISVKKEEGDER